MGTTFRFSLLVPLLGLSVLAPMPRAIPAVRFREQTQLALTASSAVGGVRQATKEESDAFVAAELAGDEHCGKEPPPIDFKAGVGGTFRRSVLWARAFGGACEHNVA